MSPLLPVLFILGTILGAVANVLIYSQRLERRAISPWMRRNQLRGADCQSAQKNEQVDNLPHATKRQWFDFVPIFGWLSLRREAAVFGAGFWVRPLLVELLMGIGVAALFQFEIHGGLLPADFPRPIAPATLPILSAQFAAHVALIFFMLVASLIDADETIIPDSITLPGTLIGLAFAALLPKSLLPDFFQNPPLVWNEKFLLLTSPNDWPAWLNATAWGGLLIGLACWFAWCFALLPRTWYRRHGRLRAIRLCMARIGRERYSLMILFLAILGVAAIALCWKLGGNNWAGLLTALVGMAAGGGTVWAVRIIGSAAMRREAMGFGDVTLMAMIGAFVGWQAGLVVFFLAPFAAIVIGLFRLVFFRSRELPYGPFLCLATLALIVYWAPIWQRTQGVFALGWFIPVTLVICFALMPLLLFALRIITGLFER